MSAGKAIPPTAAAMGSIACRREASSPTRNSRFISRPTSRKKTAIRPSSIQPRSERRSGGLAGPTASSVFQSAKYVSLHAEFAHPLAVTVQARSTTPPSAPVLANSWNGPITRATRPRRTRFTPSSHGRQRGPLLVRWSALGHPLDEERVRDREHHRPDEEPDDPEGDQATDHAGEDQEERQVGPPSDEDGSQEVVERAAEDGPREEDPAPDGPAPRDDPDRRGDH